MDQKRLFLAIAVSLAILLGFQMLVAPHLPKPPPQQIAQTSESLPSAIRPRRRWKARPAPRRHPPRQPNRATSRG